MSVQKILEYQKIDFNIYKTEKAYAQSNEKKRMAQLRADVKAKMDSLDDLMGELEKCYAQLNAYKSKLADAENSKEALTADFSAFTDLKEFDKYEKELVKYEEVIANLNRDITKTLKRIAEIGETNARTNDLITRLASDFNVAKAAAEEKKKVLLRDMIPYAKQLKALEPEIDPKILEHYKEVRNVKKKMPAFVPFSDGSCLGCGINIAVEVQKFLNNPFDYTECPHCGRMVYVMLK